MLVHDPAGWRRERMPTLPDLEILTLHEDHWRLERAYKAADGGLRATLRGHLLQPCQFLAVTSHRIRHPSSRRIGRASVARMERSASRE
jgi:hypothetical protein